MNDIPIKKLPPGKAYGYDRDTLNRTDRDRWDYRESLAHASHDMQRQAARRIPDENVRGMSPRDYKGDPE